nr:hypothetical protein [Tanacetum cinerariifolium]
MVHDKKPDLTFLRVFSALCYPTNDSENLGKLQPTADIVIFIGYALGRKGPAPLFLTPGQISSGLVPNSVLAAPYVPLKNKELDILFQPIFDVYLEPPRVERPVSPTTVVQVPIISVGTTSSATIDQDAPSLSHSLSSLKLQPPISHQGVASGFTIIEDKPFDTTDNDPFVKMFLLQNLVLKHQHQRILIQLNPFMLLNHIILSKNEVRINRLIMSLEILLDQYPPKNNLQSIPFGACTTLYWKKSNQRTSNLQ